MSLSARLDKDYIVAYKAKDSVKVSVLRMLKTAIKNKQVELQRDLEDAEVMDLITKQAKQRRESIEQFTTAGRTDLADKEAVELEVLNGYLPKQLTEEELEEAVSSIVSELGVSGMQEMGKVMKVLMERHKGCVDGQKASSIVRSKLSA